MDYVGPQDKWLPGAENFSGNVYVTRAGGQQTAWAESFNRFYSIDVSGTSCEGPSDEISNTLTNNNDDNTNNQNDFLDYCTED